MCCSLMKVVNFTRFSFNLNLLADCSKMLKTWLEKSFHCFSNNKKEYKVSFTKSILDGVKIAHKINWVSPKRARAKENFVLQLSASMHPEQYCRRNMQTVVFQTSHAILHLFFTTQRALLALTEHWTGILPLKELQFC